MRTSGRSLRSTWPTPVMVPPVPTPATKASSCGSWARISGAVEQRAARPDEAVALGRLDHGKADAVLHAPARVEVLELRPHLGADAVELGEARQAHDRRRSDQVERRAGDVGGERHARALRTQESGII